MLTRRGIEVIRGHAAFTLPRKVTVDGRVLRARGFVVATGSRPAVPAVSGLAEVPYLTSENVFDLTEFPASLAVLGGGAVGCELGQAFARLGSRVTLVEAAPRLLSAADPAAAEVISEVFTAEGITVRTGSPVETVASIPNGSGFLLRLHDSAEVTAERLLVATGRTPETAGLGLAEAGIRRGDRGALTVDDPLATTARGIYAAGDVTGLMPFTHAAYAMGRIAARNALRRRRPPERFRPEGIPWAVFPDPEVAQAGLTEEQAAALVPGARIAYLPMREVDRAVTAGRTEGFIKIIAGPAAWWAASAVAGCSAPRSSPRPPTPTRPGCWPSSKQRPSSSASMPGERPARHAPGVGSTCDQRPRTDAVRHPGTVTRLCQREDSAVHEC